MQPALYLVTGRYEYAIQICLTASILVVVQLEWVESQSMDQAAGSQLFLSNHVRLRVHSLE